MRTCVDHTTFIVMMKQALMIRTNTIAAGYHCQRTSHGAGTRKLAVIAAMPVI